MKLCTGVTSATSLGTLPRTAARRMSAMSATRFCKCEVSVLKRDGTFSFDQTLESSPSGKLECSSKRPEFEHIVNFVSVLVVINKPLKVKVSR